MTEHEYDELIAGIGDAVREHVRETIDRAMLETRADLVPRILKLESNERLDAIERALGISAK